jgi:GWxTD domain-containing protein
MRRIAAALTLFLLASVSSSQTVPELFGRAKEQVKAGAWADALKTLDALEAESAKPGNESFRAQLPAPLAFYRGVAHANLGQSDQAVTDFSAFLALQPNAQLDQTQYSKKAQAAFEKAQKAAADRGPSLADAYKAFQPRPDAATRWPVDPRWAEGPVHWIMTEAEKEAWSALPPNADRLEFVERFWAARPAGFRAEFERRVAFADENLAQDPEQAGSLTDRGMVFILMGPPSFAGRKPLRAGDDANDDAGMSTVGSHDEKVAVHTMVNSRPNGKAPGGLISTTADQYRGPGKKGAESSDNRIEIWHYRRELLPKAVGYQQVDFEFVTKQGYGVNTLQRDASPVATLDAAKASAGPDTAAAARR